MLIEKITRWLIRLRIRRYLGMNQLDINIKKAFVQLMQDDYSDSENDFFSRVESMREHLKRDHTPLDIHDFGSGPLGMLNTLRDTSIGKSKYRKVSAIVNTDSTTSYAGRLLYSLLRATEASKGIELGASLGIGTVYQGKAFENGEEKRIVTIEGADSIARYAQKTIEHMGLKNTFIRTGTFQDVLPSLLDEMKTLDYIYIDGHHQKAALLNYFYEVLPYMKNGGLIVVDDILWSKGMWRGWKEISQYSKVSQACHLGLLGLIVLKE